MVQVAISGSAVAEESSLFPQAEEQSQEAQGERPALNIFNDEQHAGEIPEASGATAKSLDSPAVEADAVPADAPADVPAAVDEPAPETTAAPPDPTIPPADGATASPSVPAGEPDALAVLDKSIEAIEKQAAADAAYETKLRDAEQEYMEACLLVQECEDTIKESKESLKDAKKNCALLASRLQLIRSRQPVQGELALVDVSPVAATAEEIAEKYNSAITEDSAIPQASGENQSPDSATAETDQSWRTVAITELDLASIKGFGKKKREAVIDAIPTIGAFEDLRVQGGAMGIADLLPRGCGKNIADGLEELEVEWLAKWRAERDQEVVVPAGEAPAVDAPAAEGDESDPDEDEDGDEEGDEDGEDGEDDADDSAPAGEVTGESTEGPQDANLRRRFREITASKVPVESKDSDAFEAGKKCCMEGGQITDCNWTSGEKQDSWLLGFLAAEKGA